MSQTPQNNDVFDPNYGLNPEEEYGSSAPPDYDSNKKSPLDDVEANKRDSLDEYLSIQMGEEIGHKIQYRSCSWQKTAALLFSEYVCLAIMSFPWSYSVLGLVPGLIITVGVAATVLITSMTLWRFCLRNPEVRDVADIGQKLFWGKKWAWYFTAACFLLNNTFIQGLHVLTGAKYLNTITDHSQCTLVFAVVFAVICFAFSLPRTFSGLSSLAVFSAVTMFIAVLLSMIFAGIEEHPGGWDGTPVKWNLWPEPGTTEVQGLNAALNIVYTFVGQITYPSFIAEMKNPRDFPKAVWAVTICEVILYSLAGSIIYVYSGNYYITAPAFGSLSSLYKKIAFSFAVPTLIFLGVLYASVSARFVIFRIFDRNSPHLKDHTYRGWAIWIGLLAILWVLAFIIAEVIPF
jgi:Transmembrane amino acid transporter protein